LTSVILAFAPALAAKLKREPVDLELFEAREEAEHLRLELAEARAACIGAMEERNALREALALERRVAMDWRDRALGPDRQAQMAQLAQMHQAQQNISPYQQASLGMQAQAMLNAQNAFAFGDFCNCVPARHDMLLPPR
jgi:hypothetical protein